MVLLPLPVKCLGGGPAGTALRVLNTHRGWGSALLALLVAATAHAATPAPVLEPTQELRYCGPPKRDKDGNIVRRADVLRAFRKVHRCPSTGTSEAICPGWDLDHVVPLACGGCDVVWNLQWLPSVLKSAAATPMHKDAWERKVYGNKASYDAPACAFKVIPGK